MGLRKAGKRPVKPLEDSSMYSTLERRPSAAGSGPVSRLESRNSPVNARMCCISEGMRPLI